MNRHETEDGMGFSGLAPSPQERAAERYEDARNKIAAAREATIKAQAAEIARLRAERDEWHERACRFAAGLTALHMAPKMVGSAVLRGVAYDIAFNCIDGETAEFQIRQRAGLAK